MRATTLSQLSVPQMKNVPQSHWHALSVDKIYAVDRDKLAAVSGDLLQRSYRLPMNTHAQQSNSSLATGKRAVRPVTNVHSVDFAGLTLGEYQTYLNNHRSTTRYQPILPTMIARRMFF